MKYLYVGLTLIVSLLIIENVSAAGKNWTDEAEFSLVSTGGNTEVTTLAAKNLFTKRLSERLSARWELQALYGKADGVVNAESYATELRGDYAQNKRLFYFISTDWLQDEFSGIDSRYVYGIGSGYKFLDGPKHFLSGEAGLTYTVEAYTDSSDSNYLGGRLFGHYDYKFTDSNKFSQELELSPDFDDSKNWRLNSETALIMALDSHFSMKTSYLSKYDNLPQAGLKKSDRMIRVTLVVNF